MLKWLFTWVWGKKLVGGVIFPKKRQMLLQSSLLGWKSDYVIQRLTCSSLLTNPRDAQQTLKCSNPAPFPNRQSMQKHKPFRFNSIPVLRNSCGWSIVLTSIRGFVKLCMSLRDDFLLFVAKCLHVLAIVSGWPWQEAKHVGVKVTVISCFDHALLCMMRRNCNVLCRPSSAGPLLWV